MAKKKAEITVRSIRINKGKNSPKNQHAPPPPPPPTVHILILGIELGFLGGRHRQ